MKHLGLLITTFALAGSVVSVNSILNKDTVKVSAEDNVLFTENFDSSLSTELANNFDVVDGYGLVKGKGMFDLGFTTVESNNYEFNFDLKYNGDTMGDIFFFIKGLDNGGDIRLAIEGNGAYWSFRPQVSGGEVYNNSGDFYGGLDYNAVNLTEKTNVKIVHYNGYLECFVNGTRRMVAHLDSFGGTQYQSYNRVKVTEGTITGLGIVTGNDDALLMDNIRIIEATGKDSAYQANLNNEKYSVMAASGQYLDHDNLRVEVNFTCNDITKSGTYPAIKLAGLNGQLFGHNVESSLNFQFYDDNNYLTPQLFARNAEGTDWTGTNSSAISMNVGDTINVVIEVAGDNIATYYNGELGFTTSFTALGISKGHLQYVMVRPGDSGYSWNDFQFNGLENENGAVVRLNKEEYTTGSEIVAVASVFGDRNQSYEWYVDGEATGVSELTYRTSTLTAGVHTFEYKNATYGSNVAKATVSDGIITIAAEKTSMYKNESIVVSASYEGDFANETKWFVDTVEQPTTGDSITLSGLDVGDHSVVAKNGNVVSNTVTITVLQSKIVLSSEKSAYSREDTAVIKAEKFGYAETAQIDWYIDGIIVNDFHGDELSVNMSNYSDGQSVIVKAMIGNDVSNDFILTIYYDIVSKLTSDPTYQILGEMPIEANKTYGTYKVVEDAEGNYLAAPADTSGLYCPVETKLPTKNAYTYEYKLYVPEITEGEYYVYPCLIGANSKFPTASIEVAFAINSNGMRPYIKDQGGSQVYDDASGSVIGDYSFDTGCAKTNDWNHVIFAVQNKSVTVNLNGTPVLFFTLPSITVPSGISMNWWSSFDGKVNIDMRVKDFKIGGLVDPAPDLESITLSTSAVEITLGQSVTVSASISPFDAEVEVYEWYINGEKQTETGKSITFTPDKAGSYEVVCVANGITSNKKTITVKNVEKDPEPEKKGCKGSIIATSAIISGLALVGVALVAFKKKED